MNTIFKNRRVFSFLLLATMLLSACAPAAGTAVSTTTGSSSPTAVGSSAPTATGSSSPTAVGSSAPTATGSSSPTAVGSSAPTAASPASTGTIKIGSKDFTEEFIVAEMYAQLLEKAGFKVERKLNLGGTPIAQTAIVNGDIDLYPEYTSTGLLTILKQKAIQDPKQIFAAVKSGYEDQFKLTWLEPSPFNDTQALAMTQAVADQNGIKTYSDLSQKASTLVLGGPAEFMERQDGIKGLQQAYGGFQFKEIKQLGTGSLRYQALLDKQIDVVVAFGTDGAIQGNHLLLLKDDKTFYPIYNIAPVVRQDTLLKYPQISAVLNKLAPMLTDQVMSDLNWQVDGPDKKEPAAVANAFLQKNGLLP